MTKIRLSSALLLFLMLGFGFANAQSDVAPATTTEPVGNDSKIEFEKELHDFGTLEHKGNGTYLFKFTNSGSEDLLIKNAKGSCGCTVPSWPREAIAPGESGEIKVTYDTKRQGGFHKTVTLTTNSKHPEHQTKRLTIKGNVKPAPPAPQPVNVQPTEGPVNNNGNAMK